MNEAEWLACEEPWVVLRCVHARTTASERAKNRRAILFAAAYCARLQPVIHFRIAGEVVRWLEATADEQPTARDRFSIANAIERACRLSRDEREKSALHALEAARTGTRVSNFYDAVVQVSQMAARALASDNSDRKAAEDRLQNVLIRDIFGNPFRPVSFNPTWRTDTAVSLARGMYDSRDFSAMPILADALQDAGCEDEQVLNHCRDANQPHVRGCWVCDLVLGKE